MEVSQVIGVSNDGMFPSEPASYCTPMTSWKPPSCESERVIPQLVGIDHDHCEDFRHGIDDG